MSVDAELDAWRREWQSAAPVLPDLVTKVQRQTRFMRMRLAAEVIATVIMGGWPTAWAARSGEPDAIVLAAATWVFLAAAWTLALKTRKGCWKPAVMNTSAFVEISVRRCRAALAGANFGTLLYFSELVFCCGWVYHRQFQNSLRSPWGFITSAPVLIFLIGTPAFLACVIWYRRKKQAELVHLQGLESAKSIDSVSNERTSSSSAAAPQSLHGKFPYSRFGRKKGFRRS